MKLLVIGSDGQLGADYVRLAPALGYQTIGLTRGDLDVADPPGIAAVLDRLDFDVIVNTAAYHGYRAYQDTTPERSMAVNAHGPYYLARYAEQHGKTLVHFSTDYVFSGCAPPRGAGFRETDRPEPANLYSASKLAGESLVTMSTSRCLVFRVASLYGARGCKAKNRSNFVETVIARLSRGETMQVVEDIVMSPTSTTSVVEKSVELLTGGSYGLYHLAGSGSCSWYQLAVEVADHQGLPGDLLVPIPAEQREQEIKRGANTALLNAKLLETGLADLPPWRTNLHRYLTEREGERE